MFDPVEDGQKHLFFRANVELVVGYQIPDFIEGEEKKFFRADYLLEILKSIFVRTGVKFLAAVGI